MKKLFLFALLWAAIKPASAQMLSMREANELYARTLQLMDAAGVASPELARAGAPLIEINRQQLDLITRQPGFTPHVYKFVTNTRAWLSLADVLPKPEPYPVEAQRQLSELREAANRLEAYFRALLDARERQVRSPDRDNLRRYAEANSRISPPVLNRPRVVFFGDSITDGWPLNEYFPDRDFVNRGISGQITGEMLGRMKADVIDLKPAAMLILAGTNDIARGVPLATIENNLTMITDLAEMHKIKVILASVLPISDYHKDKNPTYERSPQRPPETIKALNSWIAGFAKLRGFVYLNYFDALVDQNGRLRADLADDGLHPNAAGYRVMAPLAWAAIEKAIAPAAPQKGKRRREASQE